MNYNHYAVSVKEYIESPSDTILITDSYARAYQELLIESPHNYRVYIHDQAGILLLMYQDSIPTYRHPQLDLPSREMEDLLKGERTL